jgi:hypothetical protein
MVLLVSCLAISPALGATTVAPRGSTFAKAPGLEATCQQVQAVLSDGPDPGADPVGYALAQVLPLRQIHTPQRPLKNAIDALAAAYWTFYKDNGAKAAKRQVALAGKRIDQFCPGTL